MARRKDHSREELTQLALSHARDLIRSGGVPALTARALAKRMGYSAGTLYNLFPDIRTLAAALNVQSLHSFALRIQESCARSDQPQARMRLFAKAYLAFQQDEPELWALLFESGMGADTQEYAEAVLSVFEPVVESLKPLACSREAARQDAKIIWAALHGMCLLKKHAQLDVEEADPLEALVERFLQRYLP